MESPIKMKKLVIFMNQILKKDWSKMARTAGSGKDDMVSLLESRLSGLAIKRYHILESLRKKHGKQESP